MSSRPAVAPASRHTVLIGICILILAAALTVGLLVQLAGYRLITIDRRDPTYQSVITRQIARDTPQPPFIAQYPVTGNKTTDIAVKAYIDTLSRQYLQERSRRQDATLDEQLQISYVIRWLDDQTITIDFTRQLHQTNRLWDKHTATLTFDLRSGEQVRAENSIENIFKLATLLYDYRRANNTSQWTPAELMDLLDLRPGQISAIVPYGTSISFTYHIGKRVETVTIEKSLLSGSIAPQYLLTTTNDRATQPAVAERIVSLPSRDEPLNPAGKKLALTFDDGPGKETPRLLDALYKYRAKATFFVVGKNVAPHESIVKREIVEGHEIGNHTWSHPDLRTLGAEEITSQIIRTQQAIERVGSYTPRLIRPPYGAISSTVLSHLHGLTVQLWSVDTLDWRDQNTEVIYDRIMAGAKQNAVILLHDIHPSSVDAAIRAIRQLRAEGWQLVTTSQLR